MENRIESISEFVFLFFCSFTDKILNSYEANENEILLIIILFNIQILSQDSLRIHSSSNDKLLYNPNSTQKIYITNEETFIEKYEGLIGALAGALIGSFFAAFIAFRSIKKTQQNQIDFENEKINHTRLREEKIYCGFLFSIYSILLNHKQITIGLRQELDTFLLLLKRTGKLMIEKPYNYLPIDMMKECTIKTFNYQNYNSDIVLLIVTYINKIEGFYNDLNFIPLIKMKEEQQDSNEYYTIVENYFNALNGRINLLDELNDKINLKIKAEIESSSVCNFKELEEAAT